MLLLTVAGDTDIMFRHQSIRLTRAVVVLWSFTLWYNCLDSIGGTGRHFVSQLDTAEHCHWQSHLAVLHSYNKSRQPTVLDQFYWQVNVCLPRCLLVYNRLQLNSRQDWLLKRLHAFDFLCKFSRMEFVFYDGLDFFIAFCPSRSLGLPSSTDSERDLTVCDFCLFILG